MTETQYKERLNVLIRELNKYDYMFPYKPLDEDAHVMDNLDELSLYISREVKKLILEIGIPEIDDDSIKDKEMINKIQDEYNHQEFEYTGYNFDPNFKDNMLIDISNGRMPEPVKCLNNESVDYPIYYKLIYNPYIGETGYIDYRVIGEITENKIFITVNAFYFKDINNPTVFIDMSSTVSHELQHMCDMYILPGRNSLDYNGGVILDLKHNVFGLNQYSLRCVKTVVTILAKEEIRGRLAQLKRYVTMLARYKDVRDEIYANGVYNNFNNVNNGIPFISDNREITEQMLLNYLYSDNTLKSITRVDFYNNVIKRLENIATVNPGRYYAYLLVIGYYMYRHKLLRLPKKDEADRTVVRFLADENNIRKVVDLNIMYVSKLTVDIMNICHIVHLSIRANFNYYIKLVDDRIRKHLHDFYTYEKVNDVFEERIPYMDDCVILYC